MFDSDNKKAFSLLLQNHVILVFNLVSTLTKLNHCLSLSYFTVFKLFYSKKTFFE